ncbi:TPA: hypothetical protein PXF07_001990 [Mannheimia haemolytica]|uniref:Uncharacterized protein n=4 Tax=Mannheimia haemolytica TaxID=75985 RepID=A0A547EJU6_MANHA|nr:hypothetical protein [Mannheimia haemolytica]AGQ42292.1 hypothetical protein J451_12740 [Mannheimia haemolytica D174]AWW71861.1 hypothetical protein C4O86_08785 [Pasteurellaceae bacterium 12565]AGQ26756.1 hypothetical protein F382_12665 [Mannheimia haemolytica D153]AGR74706.1 hypothetical protein N220_04830 [Mannheimia haemolytica USMARC_2286]AKA11814.1 hypothetical protein WC39_09110 [Mannheimia haemolytica]
MTTINLSQQERELVEFVWNNRNTPWFFHCSVSNVSRNNTSRQIAVCVIKDNQLISLDELIAKLCGYKLRQNGLYVTVHNMDAVFDTLYRFMCKLNDEMEANENVCPYLSLAHYEVF